MQVSISFTLFYLLCFFMDNMQVLPLAAGVFSLLVVLVVRRHFANQV